MDTTVYNRTFIKEVDNDYFFFNAFTNASIRIKKENKSALEIVEVNKEEL